MLIPSQPSHSKEHSLLVVMLRLHSLVERLVVDLYSVLVVQLRQSHLLRILLTYSQLLVQLHSPGQDLTLVVVPYPLLVVELRRSHLIMVRRLYLPLKITVISLLQLPYLRMMVQLQNLLLLVKKITIQYYTIRQFNLTLVELDLSSRLVIRDNLLPKKKLMRYLLVIQITSLLRQDLFLRQVILKHRNKQEMLSLNLSSLKLVLVLYSLLAVLLRQSHKQMMRLVYSIYLDLQHSAEQDPTLVVVLYSLSMVQRKQSLGIIMKPLLILLQLRIMVTLLTQLQQLMIMDLLPRQQPQVNLLSEQSSTLLQRSH